MSKKKVYLILDIIIILLAFGSVIIINNLNHNTSTSQQKPESSLNGLYYCYNDKHNTYTKTMMMEIEDSTVIFYSKTNNETDYKDTARINIKSKKIYTGITANYSYTNGIFSFNKIKYVKEGSKIFNKAQESQNKKCLTNDKNTKKLTEWL
ncbi:hypothetical protein [Lactococcus formosensis]|uniref:hypothetical protein n=1 Tax=Lactococcus formosensis TaxID=1281486 RepID=UPI001BD18BD7|nr:hypothetical protein [Lactococcus formosensis]MDT2726861.1 hypothetical protein [Lactococcus formosensis]